MEAKKKNIITYEGLKKYEEELTINRKKILDLVNLNDYGL